MCLSLIILQLLLVASYQYMDVSIDCRHQLSIEPCLSLSFMY